jgi:hypothetical protein
MPSGEVGEVHGTIDAHTESQQGDHLDDETFAKPLETEDEEDDCYYYV